LKEDLANYQEMFQRTTKQFDEYKEQQTVAAKKTSNQIKELKGQLQKEKLTGDKLKEQNEKLDGDLRRLMEHLKVKGRETVDKKEKIIVESLSSRVNELEVSLWENNACIQE